MKKDTVKQHSLKSNIASFKNVTNLHDFDSGRYLKLTPSLEGHNFQLINFQKMRVPNAGAIMNIDV